MGIDYSRCSTADLHRMDFIGTKVVDAIVAKLSAQYPHSVDLLFPPQWPFPDIGTAETYGDEVLKDVLVAAEVGSSAILARLELEIRGQPN